MKHTIVMSIALLALLFTAACGMSPDTEPIPAFPGATEVDEVEDPVLGLLKQSMEGEQLAEGFEVDSHIYTLPVEMDFAEVEAFYSEELSGRDWTQEDAADAEMTEAGIDAAAWSHGPNQTFVVMTVDNPFGGDKFLLTVESTR